MKLDAPFYSEAELDELARSNPREALDLKNVAGALVRKRFPAIREVRNVYQEEGAI